MPIAAVILAAGKGTRFKSKTAKLLHPLLGRPMISYPLDLVRSLGVERIVVVVGHQAEAVKAACPGDDIIWAYQAEQKGTGHAVARAEEALKDFQGEVLILNGDVPLLHADHVTPLIDRLHNHNAQVAFMAAETDDPTGYGRAIKDWNGWRVVEHKDATPKERLVKDINVGIYLIDHRFLFDGLGDLSNDNAQGEYYLPDLIHLGAQCGLRVEAQFMDDVEAGLGVNDRAQLASACSRLRRERVHALMVSGVTCQDPFTTYIEGEVTVEPDVCLGAGVHLIGPVHIGAGARIEPNCYIIDSTISAGAVVPANSRLESTKV